MKMIQSNNNASLKIDYRPPAVKGPNYIPRGNVNNIISEYSIRPSYYQKEERFVDTAGNVAVKAGLAGLFLGMVACVGVPISCILKRKH